jgi:hypothetical protein
MQIKAFSPYAAVENIHVREDSDIQVWSQNVVESTNFLISEKSVGIHTLLASVRVK